METVLVGEEVKEPTEAGRRSRVDSLGGEVLEGVWTQTTARVHQTLSVSKQSN